MIEKENKMKALIITLIAGLFCWISIYANRYAKEVKRTGKEPLK